MGQAICLPKKTEEEKVGWVKPSWCQNLSQKLTLGICLERLNSTESFYTEFMSWGIAENSRHICLQGVAIHPSYP